MLLLVQCLFFLASLVLPADAKSRPARQLIRRNCSSSSDAPACAHVQEFTYDFQVESSSCGAVITVSDMSCPCDHVRLEVFDNGEQIYFPQNPQQYLHTTPGFHTLRMKLYGKGKDIPMTATSTRLNCPCGNKGICFQFVQTYSICVCL